MIAESRAGSQEQRAGGDQEKINSLDRNYNDVIRKNAGMLRKTFKKHGEALLLMRVPDAFRAQARHEGMWLQERLVGDATGDSATQLYVPGANKPVDIPKISLTQETLNAQLEECNEKLRILSKLKAKLKFKKKIKHSLEEDIHNAKIAVTDMQVRIRNHEAKRTERLDAEFQKYVENCIAMIGHLQDMCSPLLIEELEANEEYNGAIDKGDIVRVGYLTRSFVMDTDTKNVKRERQKRFAELLVFKLKKGDKFGPYADKFLKMYKEYRSMCDGGVVLEDNEDSLVQAVILNTMHMFGEMGRQWMMDPQEKNRPSTVSALMERLLLYDRRMSYAESLCEDPAPKRVKNETDNDIGSTDLIKAVKVLSATINNMRPIDATTSNAALKSKSKSCYNFNRTGSCKFGDSCRYKHNNDITNVSNIPIDLYCRNILKFGSCRKGTECPRANYHDESYRELIKLQKSYGNSDGNPA